MSSSTSIMRLTKIYTRTGDQGETHFANKRLAKDEVIIDLIGTLDELNSCVGLTLSFMSEQTAIIECLTQIQQHLFDMGGELHAPDHPVITAELVKGLETTLDKLNASLPPLKEFVLPRGPSSACACHLSRTVCRRAERLMVTYQREQPNMNSECLRYLNRLSDLLFVIARILSREVNPHEVLWKD